MKRLACLLALSVTTWVAQSFAQTAETIPFAIRMLPTNENPPLDLKATADGLLLVHVVRDSSGKVVSGSVDFQIDFNFPSAVTITGLHIHQAPAGVNGPILIPTDVGNPTPIQSDTGQGSIRKQAQITADNNAGVAALRALLDDPTQFYANLHPTVNGGGAVRAQLQRTNVVVLMGLMNSANAGASTLNASGVGTVILYANTDDSGALTLGGATFGVTYNFPSPVTFTGLHIHKGAAGVMGGIFIPTTLSSFPSADSGAGRLPDFTVPVLPGSLGASVLLDVMNNPGNYYLNAHTTNNPGGAIRAQLHFTDRMVFQANLLPSNSTPPITTLNASAPSGVTVYALRNEDGSIAAATVLFDTNYRFPANNQFVAEHIHDGAAGVMGPVTVPTRVGTPGFTPSNPTGFGNFFDIEIVGPADSDKAALATLRDLAANPENHYLNIHTQDFRGGAARAQLGPAITAKATLAAATNAAFAQSAKTLAPGELFAIFGSSLAKTTSGLSGWSGKTIPSSLNGVKVTIGGKSAPLLYVSPNQVNAQVPFDTPNGAQMVTVDNGNGSSTGFTVTIASASPAIFTLSDGTTGIVVKAADFSLLSADNPAKAGDALVIYSTGLGQTTPTLITGGLADVSPLSNTVPVSVTIGGKPAALISSVAAPGFVGLYQTAVTVPDGISGGTAPLVLSVGSITSNSVNIAVQ
jgi:uncharacterized protein (TIGR03437 family)